MTAVAAAAAAAAAAAGKPMTPVEAAKASSSIVGAFGLPPASADKPEVTTATLTGTVTTTTSGYTTPTGSTSSFGSSRKSSSTPSLSATTAGDTKTTTVRGEDSRNFLSTCLKSLRFQVGSYVNVHFNGCFIKTCL